MKFETKSVKPTLYQHDVFKNRTRDNARQHSELTDTKSINSVISDFYYDYYNVRFLAKIGVFWRLFPFTLGINLTMPSINLFGNGDTLKNDR